MKMANEGPVLWPWCVMIVYEHIWDVLLCISVRDCRWYGKSLVSAPCGCGSFPSVLALPK